MLDLKTILLAIRASRQKYGTLFIIHAVRNLMAFRYCSKYI